MFVYRRKDLPPDPVFPANLEKLGYFVNDKDQIRKITRPNEEFQFKINRNPRWNEAQREAMNACIRDIVSGRLHDLGFRTIRLPLSTPVDEPHVPILVSKNLATASRVVVVFGESIQDIGVWAYRSIGTDGIDQGSAVAFARAILEKNKNNSTPKDQEDVAIVLANTGQLTWHCASRRAVTQATWLSMPRHSAVEGPPTTTRRNKIPRNGNWQEHVTCVFEDILAARGDILSEKAKIDIVGVAEGGLGAIRYLANNWETWKDHVSAICLPSPLHLRDTDLLPESPETDEDKDITSYTFPAFISSRCRAYVLSDQPLDAPVSGFHEYGCNCYSSNEALNMECIMPMAWKGVIEWLDKVHADPDYAEPHLIIKEMNGNGAEHAVVEEVK